MIGEYGIEVGGGTRSGVWPALLCVRTRFGVTDPAKASDLKLSLTHLGGAVVYVNGREVARNHMPSGPIEPVTLANDYPPAAYVLADGRTPLPRLQGSDPPDECRDRYEQRIRKLNVTLPREALVRGGNVLAIELHQAAVVPPTGVGADWSHVGVRKIQLTSRSGGGAIPYAQAVNGLLVWNAWPMETIADRRVEQFRFAGWKHAPSGIGAPLKGLSVGNPFDPLRPVRMAAPRGGVCSGQLVLTDFSGLKDVSAELGPLTGPGGAEIPANAVQLRYAVQPEKIHYCDVLTEDPVENAITLPIWILVEVPKNQAPGWYRATLTATANGQDVHVPIQVLVCAWTLPDPKHYRSFASVMHSPDTLAMHYGVEPWSPEHFDVMERSVELLGQLGNNVMFVPVILHTHGGYRTGMIRWVKADGSLRPDFSAFERYVDLYLKHCAAPNVICLTVWEPRFTTTFTHAYEGGVSSRKPEETVPLRVTGLDPKTGQMFEVPAPMIGDEGSEAFWKPMFDGFRDLVRKRGWSERIIMVGQAFDDRPTKPTVECLKRLAPYARWVVFSHFAGDPGPKDGRLIVRGDLNIGLQELPGQPPWPAMFPGDTELQKLEFFRVGNYRFNIQQESSPDAYRNVAWRNGSFCRFAVDYWPIGPRQGGPMSPHTGLFNPRGWHEWRVYTNVPFDMTAPGPAGPVATVRFQMLREAVQEAEAWISISQALRDLPSGKQQPYRDLWSEASLAYGVGHRMTQMQLSLGWPGRIARTYIAAGELAGMRTQANWQDPPR